jgi:hypothetical protein
MKPTVVTFSKKLDAEMYFANCIWRNPDFRVHDIGSCSVDGLQYYVVHTMKIGRKPSKLIASVYRGIVRRERAGRDIYLGD